MKKSAEASPKAQTTKVKSRSQTPTNLSPVESPPAPSTKDSPSEPDIRYRNEPASLLRLMSTRSKDSAASASIPGASPSYRNFSISSPDSDDETRVLICLLDKLLL